MLIGLTGMSGAGKSTVAALFEKKGFRIIDCDALVHSLYEDIRYLRLIREAFGEKYICGNKVDRKKLGAFVFSVVLGIIFGMYPAIKASGLQPVAALRAD